MNITVTKTQVSVDTNYILNDKEYNVNTCYFTFSDDYSNNLVKKAIFVQGNNTIEMSIINNQCQIPEEVLNNGTFQLRVYAYEVDGEELVLRYSPSYATAYVRTGSYIENAEAPEVITPTQFEQYMQAMNDGLNEVANVDIDAEQLDNGMSVTITNRNGEDKTVYAYDGEKGDKGDKGDKGNTGATGATGATGNGISSIEKTSASGLVDTYTITFTNGTTTTFNVTNGKGISSISKTSTSGLIDTYTITYNDNTTSTFEVINGRGITSIDLTSTQDNIDTYTITYNDGTTSTYTVTNSTVTDQEFEELQERTEYLGKYANALIKQNSSDTNLTINDTAECPMPIELSPSELSQESEPTPTSPQDVHTITGSNTLSLYNKNLIINANIEQGGFNFHTGVNYNSTSQLRETVYNILPNIQYTISCNEALGEVAVCCFDNNNNSLDGYSSTTTNNYYTFTTKENTSYIKVRIGNNTYPKTTSNNYNIQLEKNANKTNYQVRTTNNYTITLGDLEYCKIGNYSDIFFKNTTDSEYYDSTLELNKWYLKKNIVKVVLDGSEGWTLANTPNVFYMSFLNENYLDENNIPLSNYFIGVTNASNAVVMGGNKINTIALGKPNAPRIYIKTDIVNSAIGLETWLSNNNVVIYYQLETPTNILLNDTLQAEIEQIYNWLLSYQGQTNISQINYDLPFIINATTCYDLNKLLTRVEVLEAEQ